MAGIVAGVAILYGRKAICEALADEHGVPASRDVALALRRAGLPIIIAGDPSSPGARWALDAEQLARFFSRPRGFTRSRPRGQKGKAR